jgi:hypothetical protein
MRWSPTHTDWAFAMIEGDSPNGRHDAWPSNRGRRDSSVGRESAVGIPGALLATGIGLAIAGGDYFWPGVYLAYGTIAWLLADWWFFSKPLTPGKRVTGAATTLVFAALVSWMAFRPSPLGIFAISEDTNFEPDTEIYGIKWGPNYFPMKLVISNESASPYADLEIIVRTDLMIKEIGSSAGPKCSYSSYLPGVLIANPTMTHTDARGKSVPTRARTYLRLLRAARRGYFSRHHSAG